MQESDSRATALPAVVWPQYLACMAEEARNLRRRRKVESLKAWAAPKFDYETEADSQSELEL